MGKQLSESNVVTPNGKQVYAVALTNVLDKRFKLQAVCHELGVRVKRAVDGHDAVLRCEAKTLGFAERERGNEQVKKGAYLRFRGLRKLASPLSSGATAPPEVAQPEPFEQRGEEERSDGDDDQDAKIAHDAKCSNLCGYSMRSGDVVFRLGLQTFVPDSPQAGILQKDVIRADPLFKWNWAWKLPSFVPLRGLRGAKKVNRGQIELRVHHEGHREHEGNGFSKFWQQLQRGQLSGMIVGLFDAFD
jgi:hypothetical protein